MGLYLPVSKFCFGRATAAAPTTHALQAGNNENLHPQRNMQAQPAAPDAKLQRRSLEAEEGPKAGSGAASVPNWTDQRFQDPELDYG